MSVCEGGVLQEVTSDRSGRFFTSVWRREDPEENLSRAGTKACFPAWRRDALAFLNHAVSVSDVMSCHKGLKSLIGLLDLWLKQLYCEKQLRKAAESSGSRMNFQTGLRHPVRVQKNRCLMFDERPSSFQPQSSAGNCSRS